MTEALGKQVDPLKVGEKFEFYIGIFSRKAQIVERSKDGKLVLNMVDGGNPHWETSVESLRRSPVHRTLEEGPKPLSYKGNNKF